MPVPFVAKIPFSLLWLTLTTVAIATEDRAYELRHAWSKLQFPDCPVGVAFTNEPSPTGIVVLQRGMVHVLPADREAAVAPVFLDLKDRLKDEIHFEAGLHAVVFHPDFAKNHRVYLSYSQSEPRRAVLSEMMVREGAEFRADPATERILLEVPHQLADHFSGSLAFGPDGMLYWSIGDGGMRDDPHGMAQHPFLLQGKVLRIDVNHRSGSRAYAIPPDNPFADKQEWRGEIYAMGFRNPWGMSFDPGSGELWLADVGQEMFEEINVVTKGGNYGWAERDGPKRLMAKGETQQAPGEFIDPVHSYSRTTGEGICIAGGFVYRGSRLPKLVGCYLYGDWGYGKVWAFRRAETREAKSVNTLLFVHRENEERFNPTQICADPEGEPLILNHSGWIETLAEVAK
ncbi:MAG: PQQ-dependent sugar dehydrogenase [Verrucomicrobiales bacterium]|nr:PQQ-dependent sugar dehydrogenase [Verrucomicrobiales bacterium]